MTTQINEGSIVQLTHPERRRLARFPLEVLVRIEPAGTNRVEMAQTRNVSACGMYFITQMPLKIGQKIECVLMLPERLTLASSPVLIGCQAEVLRLDRNPGDRQIGVAVEVHSCDFSWADLENSEPQNTKVM